jgi:hypothetical protein
VDRAAHPQPAAHALPGGRRDRHDRAPAVHRAADRALQEPADGGHHRAEPGGELLLVDVVHHLHDGLGAVDEQRGEERDPVLAVDQVVEPAGHPAQHEGGARVDAQGAARPHDGDAVDDLAGGAAGHGGGQPHDLGTRLRPTYGDPVHVHLGATSLRVVHVAPVEDHDALARQAAQRGRALRSGGELRARVGVGRRDDGERAGRGHRTPPCRARTAR